MKEPRIELHTGQDLGAKMGVRPVYPFVTIDVGGFVKFIKLDSKGRLKPEPGFEPSSLMTDAAEAMFKAYKKLGPQTPGKMWLRPPGQKLTIGLVGCGKLKKKERSKAKDLYLGELFKKSRAWVEKNCDEWGVISARHGLLSPNKLVSPYDRTLSKMDREWRHGWAQKVSHQVYCRWGEDTHYILLAGELYRQPFEEKYLRGDTCTEEAPMRGLGLGEQLGWLKRSLGGSS
jgi:hypothetical protein